MKFKTVTRFIKRFITSIIIILLLNIITLAIFIFSSSQQPSSLDTVKNLVQQIDIKANEIILSDSGKELANNKQVWIMILDAETGQEVYEYKKPSQIPNSFSLSEIVKFTRYYLEDYPVFTQVVNDKIEVFGFPKSEVFRLPFDYYEKSDLYSVIGVLLLLFILNCFYLLAVYTYSSRFISRKLTPLVQAIKTLPQGLQEAVTSQDDLQQLTDAINLVDDKLKDSEKFKESWISGIAHDIKTPLSVIVSNTSLAIEKTDGADLEKYLKPTLIEAHYIQNLLNDLNIFARLTDGNLTLNKESVTIVPFFKEIIIQIINQEIWDDFTFEFIPDKNLKNKRMYVEKALLSRVLHNLIYNSVLHNNTGCHITIKLDLYDDEELFSLTVRDDGVGTSPDRLKHINSLENFNFDISGVRRSGMGLRISKQIVNLHNGLMTVSSQQGNYFQTQISLPIEH